MNKNREKEIAQAVGLWLAEGDNKTKSEITITNNSSNLIIFFHSIITKIFNLKNLPRVYVYSSSKNEKPTLDISVAHKFYLDKRSKTPYFIYRIADVELVKKWHKMVETLKQSPKFYIYTLQGFFAGEGNVKFIPKSKTRILRISQGKPNIFLEEVLNYLDIFFKYSLEERSYLISRRYNLDKLLKIDIAILHKTKNKKFKRMMESYKQYHYPKKFLKKELYDSLLSPHTSLELAKKFNRSQSRITRILVLLKKERKVNNFRVGSKDYWIQQSKKIIISKRKREILDLLNSPKKTVEVASKLNVDWKTAHKRLNELKRLNLVKQTDNLWYESQNKKEVITF